MDEELSQLPIDNTLTIATAYERGYTWVMDIDQVTLRELLADVVTMVNQEGYQLGQPRYTWPEQGATKQERGLYEPLHSQQGDKKEEKSTKTL